MTGAVSIDALLPFMSANLPEAGHILLVEEWGIATIDGEEQTVVYPLMHRLPSHPKELAHVDNGE